ncbi:hypothetical protein T492DRAFT_1003341, partial [Pavlovales sp. CCMP2436]
HTRTLRSFKRPVEACQTAAPSTTWEQAQTPEPPTTTMPASLHDTITSPPRKRTQSRAKVATPQGQTPATHRPMGKPVTQQRPNPTAIPNATSCGLTHHSRHAHASVSPAHIALSQTPSGSKPNTWCWTRHNNRPRNESGLARRSHPQTRAEQPPSEPHTTAFCTHLSGQKQSHRPAHPSSQQRRAKSAGGRNDAPKVYHNILSPRPNPLRGWGRPGPQ